jgi:MerR family transcriptional regulator, redox-sensitive transcriptional activator SoxR
MRGLSIAEVASRVGLRPSALRYYEQIGILMPVERRSGRRRYSPEVLYRLTVVQRARRMGFTLDEIRRLFFGFGKTTPVSERWRKLSQQKITELESMQKEIEDMQRLLRDMTTKCRCETVEQCGRGIFRTDFEQKRSAMNRVHRRKIRRK